MLYAGGFDHYRAWLVLRHVLHELGPVEFFAAYGLAADALLMRVNVVFPPGGQGVAISLGIRNPLYFLALRND